MKVKLLKDLLEGGRVKQTRRGTLVERKSADGSPLEPSYVPNPNHADVAYVRGAVVEVSETTGQKWVEKGLAEETTEESER